MEIINLIIQNFTTLCLAVGLSILIISNKNFDKKTNRIFLILVAIIIALVASETLDKHFQKLDSPCFFRYIISAFGYTVRPCVIVLLINISMRRKKSNIMLWIPIIILGIVAFTDYFTHLMFWYNEINWFKPGPFAYLAHIVSLFYLIIFLLLVVQRRKNISYAEIFLIIFSSVICLVATILETVLPNANFLIVGSMSVSSALYYIVLYAETFRIDVLTGLLNRKSLYINFNRKKTKPFVVVSVDLNCLKDINDTYGHIAGDKALKNLAEVLLKESKNDFVPYRTGGDEFILIGREQTDAQINSFFENVKQKLNEKNIMASFGYAFYKPGDSFDDICNKADEHMYKDKRHYRSRSQK